MKKSNTEAVYARVLSGHLEIREDGSIHNTGLPNFITKNPRCPNGYTQSSGKAGPVPDNFSQSGYRRVEVRIDGKRINTGVARLVWRHFHGPIPEGLDINHIDGNRVNNHPLNLELVTPSENVIHARDILKRRWANGQQVNTVKLTPEQVREIRALRVARESAPKIAKKYGVTSAAVYAIEHRISWRHLD